MVPSPNDPIIDPVLSKSKRLLKALLFILTGYLVYYLLIDLVLLRPNLGSKNMLLLNWVFFIVWTLMSFITILSIYWPDFKSMKKEVVHAEATLAVEKRLEQAAPSLTSEKKKIKKRKKKPVRKRKSR
ncbi:MAG: hypothetical protein V1725_07630 [archaeon]